jgi:hypothetical protein
MVLVVTNVPVEDIGRSTSTTRSSRWMTSWTMPTASAGRSRVWRAGHAEVVWRPATPRNASAVT